MGFDISGIKPVSSHGEYFRANVWWWRALWSYVAELADDVLTVNELDAGQYNDGAEINEKKASIIGSRIKEQAKNGKLKDYEDEYMEHLNNIPLEDCKYCEGSGKRIWKEDGKRKAKDCNVCNTEYTREQNLPIGKVKNWSCNYPFSADFTKEFGKFCEESGGFEIW